MGFRRVGAQGLEPDHKRRDHQVEVVAQALGVPGGVGIGGGHADQTNAGFAARFQTILHVAREVENITDEERRAFRHDESRRRGGPAVAVSGSEKRAFDRFRRQRGAVQRNQGILASRAKLMNRAGHKSFAGTGFADDQHGRGRSGGGGDLIEEASIFGTAADQGVGRVSAQETLTNFLQFDAQTLSDRLGEPSATRRSVRTRQRSPRSSPAFACSGRNSTQRQRRSPLE